MTDRECGREKQERGGEEGDRHEKKRNENKTRTKPEKEGRKR